MNEQISTLLVYDSAEPVGTLKLALDRQSLICSRVHTCQQAAPLLERLDPPYLVFTDTTLPDGTWEDVLAMAAQAAKAVNVIVVSRLADVKVYIEAMEKGARDFLAPPFEVSDLAYVVRAAADNVRIRRYGLAHAA